MDVMYMAIRMELPVGSLTNLHVLNAMLEEEAITEAILIGGVLGGFVNNVVKLGETARNTCIGAMRTTVNKLSTSAY
jgi:hypothetical protein